MNKFIYIIPFVLFVLKDLELYMSCNIIDFLDINI